MTCTHSRPLSIADHNRFRVAKTWRSPIEKAVDTYPDYEWLHDIADASANDVRAAFLNAVEKLRGTAKEAQLRAALESGNVARVMTILDVDAQMASAMSAQVIPHLEDTFIAAGRATMSREGRMAMRFDLANPHAQAFIRQYDFNLIRQVSQETRDGVQRVVLDAFKYGGHPREQARQIRQFIGLTDKQSQAVLTYRDNLILEDREPDQIERMVERYRQAMLKRRAETIARTETINASNAGQAQAWDDAAGKGLLNRATFRQGWLTVPSDRTCIYCAAVPLLNPNGVPLGGMFITPLGPVARPTLHPNCRCTLYVMSF